MRDFLATIHIFAGVSEDALDFLAGLAKPVDLKAGAFVFHDGDLSNAFYVIDNGSVEVLKGKESDNPSHIATLQTGDFFGEMSICLLYTSPSPRDRTRSRMPSSA